MFNQQPNELQMMIDQMSNRGYRINWYTLDVGLRANENYRDNSHTLVLLDLLAPLISPERRRFNSQREGWLKRMEEETKVMRYFLNLFKNNKFVGETLLGSGSENQPAFIGPKEFVRLLGWGLNFDSPAEFYRTVFWLLKTATLTEIECQYELGLNVTTQFALGFVRTMKFNKPAWIDQFPLQGPAQFDEYFVRHLQVVEKVEPTDEDGKQTLFKRPGRESDVSYYFEPDLRDSCDSVHRHFGNDIYKSTLLIQNANGVGSNNMQVELEFTRLKDGQEVRLFLGKQPSHFSGSLEMTQFKLNPELLGLLLRVALAGRMQVELKFEPTDAPFTELTGNVFIPDAGFTATGFPRLY